VTISAQKLGRQLFSTGCCRGDGSPLGPASLAEALDTLAKDAVVQEGLGAAYAKYYLKVKTEEWTLHNRTVTPWERDYYLATY